MKSDKFLKINKAEKKSKKYGYVKYIKGENVWKVNQRAKVSKSLDLPLLKQKSVGFKIFDMLVRLRKGAHTKCFYIAVGSFLVSPTNLRFGRSKRLNYSHMISSHLAEI